MPFTPINVVNGSTPANATWGNLVQTQYTEAISSLNQDLFVAFVLSGLIAHKDSVTANKLDVAAGVAYVLQTDSTTRRRAPVASSQTTAALSSTYYLYLQPDGTWYWATTNTPAANSLFIAQVTTDGSGNISTVTDKRTLGIALLSGKDTNLGALVLPAPLSLTLFQNGALAGAVVGGVTFAQAGAILSDYDTSASFNGSSGYISAPASSLPTGNGAWTLEAWVNFSVAPGAGYNILQFGASGTNNSAELYIDASGKLGTNFYGGAQVFGNVALTGAWHHVAATWDGTTQRTYVDGVAQTATGTPGAATLGSAFCVLGAQTNGTTNTNFFNGKLARAAIYNTALAAARITAHYNAASAVAGGYDAVVLSDSPLRYYKLADPSGAVWAADTTSPAASALVDAGGNLSPAGRLTTLGGQATAGGFGAPVIVAQSIRFNVTTIGSNVTVLSFTPSVTGFYRVTGYVLMQDTAARALGFFVTWTDPDLNSGLSEWLAAPGGTSGFAIQAFNNSNTWNNNVPFGAFSPPFMAKAGTSIVVSYQHDTGTANDFVTAVIERLA